MTVTASWWTPFKVQSFCSRCLPVEAQTLSGDSDWQKFLRTQSPWSFSSHHLYSAWFKSVGVLRNIRSHRDVALETEQAAEKQVGSQSPASEIRIAASSMMEHRQGHMILQGKTKSECLMNQPRTSTDTKTHPVTLRFHLAFGLWSRSTLMKLQPFTINSDENGHKPSFGLGAERQKV